MNGAGLLLADRLFHAYYVSFWPAVEVGAWLKRSAPVERCQIKPNSWRRIFYAPCSGRGHAHGTAQIRRRQAAFRRDVQRRRVLDVLRGYRTNSEWYIGFMLLAPSFRDQGFGTEIHNEFVRYARSAGAHRLLLAVHLGFMATATNR